MGPCGGHLQPPSSLMVRGSPVPHAQHRSSKKPKTPGVHGPNRYHPLLILVGLDVLLGESPTQQTRHAHTPSATNQGAVLAPQTKPPHRLDERSHRQLPLPWGPGQHPLAPRKGAGRKRNRQSEWAGAAALHWKPGHRQPAPGPLQHREGSVPANPWPPAPRDAGEGRHQGLQLVQSTRSGVSDCRAAGGDSRGPLLAWPPCPARSTDQLTGACYLHQESQQDEAGSSWTNKHVKIAKVRRKTTRQVHPNHLQAHRPSPQRECGASTSWASLPLQLGTDQSEHLLVLAVPPVTGGSIYRPPPPISAPLGGEVCGASLKRKRCLPGAEGFTGSMGQVPTDPNLAPEPMPGVQNTVCAG